MAEYTTLPKTGYTKGTPDHLMLNAGAILSNLSWEDNKWNGDLLGATSGGSSLSLVNTYRQAEIDGVFAPTVGSDSIESSEAKFEVNMIEWTAENIKMALLGDIEDADGTEYPSGYQVITTRRKITKDDYIKNLAYVGTISGSDTPVIVIMHHAIATGGLEFEPQDKTESIYKMTFEGRAGEEDVNDTSLPVTILYPKATEAAGKSAAYEASDYEQAEYQKDSEGKKSKVIDGELGDED